MQHTPSSHHCAEVFSECGLSRSPVWQQHLVVAPAAVGQTGLVGGAQGQLCRDGWWLLGLRLPGVAVSSSSGSSRGSRMLDALITSQMVHTF